MNVHWWDDVSQTLTADGIKNSVCENGQGIMVDRDSIVNNTIGRTEQDHYDRLIVKLQQIFPYRFFYGRKTDEWLLLQI